MTPPAIGETLTPAGRFGEAMEQIAEIERLERVCCGLEPIPGLRQFGADDLMVSQSIIDLIRAATAHMRASNARSRGIIRVEALCAQLYRYIRGSPGPRRRSSRRRRRRGGRRGRRGAAPGDDPAGPTRKRPGLSSRGAPQHPFAAKRLDVRHRGGLDV